MWGAAASASAKRAAVFPCFFAATLDRACSKANLRRTSIKVDEDGLRRSSYTDIANVLYSFVGQAFNSRRTAMDSAGLAHTLAITVLASDPGVLLGKQDFVDEAISVGEKALVHAAALKYGAALERNRRDERQEQNQEEHNDYIIM